MKPSQMFSHWEQVREELLATIDRFSDEELRFKFFEGSWPVGQIMLHIADCEDNWLYGIVQHKLEPWVFYDFADHPSKTDIKELLNRAHRRTQDFLEGLEEADLEKQVKVEGELYSLGWIIWHVLEHEIHHRGELSVAHGMLGREGLDV